jgi:hypothetical protein
MKKLIVKFPNDAEYEQLKIDAHQHNCNLSEYIRYLVAKERKEMSEIERIRNIPSRECISREEIEKYRLVEERKEREKYGGGK